MTWSGRELSTKRFSADKGEAMICIVCARGGSKGVPNKNIRLLAGKPLIAWTIGHALDCRLFDTIAVSSDSPEILAVAKSAGATLLVERPAELATDEASALPAILHCLEHVEKKSQSNSHGFVYLQATSPLRLPEDICNAVQLFELKRPGSVVSVQQARASPYFTIIEEDLGGRVRLSKQLDNKIVRRQDAPTCFELNGSIYVFDKKRFWQEPQVLYKDTIIYQMPPERSVDIDTEQDFHFAEFLIQSKPTIVRP